MCVQSFIFIVPDPGLLIKGDVPIISSEAQARDCERLSHHVGELAENPAIVTPVGTAPARVRFGGVHFRHLQ